MPIRCYINVDGVESDLRVKSFRFQKITQKTTTKIN